jgi:cobalt-precorrin 5A hydrolase
VEGVQVTRVIVGVGFRSAATPRSILDAVDAACAAAGGLKPQALATAADKAAETALVEAAAALGAPVIAISPAAFAAADAAVETRSAKVEAARGVGSVCEAAALAALGPGARLAARRRLSPDGAAAAAVAVLDGPGA